jgi:hypothetical protein
LRGAFPVCPVGGKNANVLIIGGTDPFAEADVTGPESWQYCNGTGEFICNSTASSKVEPTLKYWQF